MLTDKNYLNKIIKSLNLSANDTVVEIGAGSGLLTLELAKTAKKVFAVESEREILKTLKENLSNSKLTNVQVIESNFLKLDLSSIIKTPFVAVGNIPYNITSKIIIKLLGEIDKVAPHIDLLKNIYLMLQLEVAKRITAVPRTKSYSPLSILVQYFCDPQILFKVPAGAFFPKPGVDSAFVDFHKKNTFTEIDNPTHLKQIIRISFQGRRKKILNSLRKIIDDKEYITRVFEKNGLDCNLRPDQISFDEYIKISKLVSK